MKVELVTGAYESRSLLAEAQRCVNLYAEKNPPDSPFPYTYYPTPGLTLRATATPTHGSGWRALHVAGDGSCYGVCGSSVYSISSAFVLKKLGDISSQSGHVAMNDNGQSVVIVDGSSGGWQITLSSQVFAPIASSGFQGGTSVGIVDGIFVLNVPNSRQWYVSNSNEVTFDATLFATKSGAPDLLAAIGVSKRYVYLIGAQTVEVWFDGGDFPFPFDRLPGVFMQWGCVAPASVAQMDGSLYWLAQSPQGKALVVRTEGFNAAQISTFALNDAMQNYPDLADATGFTWQLDGHLFYVLSFPTSDVTWQYDLSTQQWNELASIDNNGVLHRSRANCHAAFAGASVVGDFENGNLYTWDRDVYTDNGQPIPRIRSFPHGVDDSSNRIRYQEFIANMEVGNGIGAGAPVPVFLRYSDTRGKSWGNYVQRTLGLEGEYLTSVQWRRLGVARDRVFEISWSAPVKTALLGAWVDAQSSNQ